MSEAVQVQQVQQAAWLVTRHMPGVHSRVEFWRPFFFRRAAERFVRLVYNVNVDVLDDAALQVVEKLVQLGQHTIEVHMTLQARSDELPVLTDIVRQLREAVDGLQQGLPPDPAKRPSDEALMERLARDLREAGAA